MSEELIKALIALCGFTSASLFFLTINLCLRTILMLYKEKPQQFITAETELMKQKAIKLKYENKKTEMEIYKK